VPLGTLVDHAEIKSGGGKLQNPVAGCAGGYAVAGGGKTVAPGQFIRYMYTRDASKVRAWDLHGEVDPRLIDTQRYCTLLDRSVETVLKQHRPVHKNLFGMAFTPTR
jgi:hypothetical protein